MAINFIEYFFKIFPSERIKFLVYSNTKDNKSEFGGQKKKGKLSEATGLTSKNFMASIGLFPYII